MFLAAARLVRARREIPRGYGGKLAAIFALGALQGAMGWYMVQSGLVDDPRVSQFRLTAHLGAGARDLRRDVLDRALAHVPGAGGAAFAPGSAAPVRFAFALAALVFVMALTGGFVAGIRAGFAYNTFPLMNGALVPPEILMLEPAWRNFFYNMATVQFDHRAHRVAARGPRAVALVDAAAYPRAAGARAHAAATCCSLLVALQIALGISTLLLVVPVPLAAAHQAGAVLVFAAALNVAHALR